MSRVYIVGISAITVCALVLLALLPLQTNVSAHDAPARPPQDLSTVRKEPEHSPVGAFIEVRVPPVKGQDIWVVVQWRDNQGKWRDIDGWRGQFDEYVDGVGKKTWWVDEGQFGSGPFKWIVYDRSDGRQLGESPLFTLPIQPGQVLTRWISLTAR